MLGKLNKQSNGMKLRDLGFRFKPLKYIYLDHG